MKDGQGERWMSPTCSPCCILVVGGGGAMGIRGGRRRKEESLDSQPTVQSNSHTRRQPNKN